MAESITDIEVAGRRDPDFIIAESFKYPELAQILNAVLANPLLSAYSGKYRYIFGIGENRIIQPGQEYDLIRYNGAGFLMGILMALFGSSKLMITVEAITKGSVNSVTYDIDFMFAEGNAKSSLFRMKEYDPIANIYSYESIPQNFVVFFDDLFRMTVKNYGSVPISMTYKWVLAVINK